MAIVVGQVRLLLFHSPLCYAVCFLAEAHADAVHLSRVGQIGFGVAFVGYLLQGLVGLAVQFELEDIDELGRLHNHIASARTVMKTYGIK